MMTHRLGLLPGSVLALSVLLGGNPAASAQVNLATNTSAISAIDGGTQILSLNAGPSNAGNTYLILGSATGTAPGVPLQGVPVPLNVDPYFLLTAGSPNSAILPGSLGTLDANGRAVTPFQLPPLGNPTLIGTTLHHAYIVATPAGSVVDASNPVPVTLTESTLSIENPVDGSSVGTGVVDVSGTLGSTLSGDPSVQLFINGNPGTIIPGGPGEEDRFLVENVGLNVGLNGFDVSAQSGSTGHFESDSAVVESVLLTANNVQLSGGRAFAARGGPGFVVVDLSNGQFASVAPPTGSQSVDDLSIADGFLFALDAAGAGRLSVFSLANPEDPQLVSGPIAVPVGPFAGVSAAGGRVVVSGGTGLLTVRTYSPSGVLSASVATTDLGIGQPDVLLSADGANAFVSTDFAGSVGGAGFGLTTISLANPPTSPTTISQTGIPGAGFTSGFMAPANFPIESAILGNFVLVAHGAGLTVIQAATGQLVTTLPVGISGVNVAAVGSTAYVAGLAGVVTVDMTNPAVPQVISSESSGALITGIAADNEHLVLASPTFGLLARDL